MPNSSPSTLFDSQGLPHLEAQVKDFLGLLGCPGKPWVPQKEQVTDVVIVGGGMCGMLAWFALTSAGIVNIRVLDRSPLGREGPWLNYARMETLRSPKELTVPSYGHAYLTFQAWFRAQYGAEAWNDIGKIPRPMWMEYLQWYRRVLNIPVENNISVDQIGPENELIRVDHSGEQPGSFLARKVIFATGRDGTGRPSIPQFVEGLPRKYWATPRKTSTLPPSRARRLPSSASELRQSTMRPRLWRMARQKCGI